MKLASESEFNFMKHRLTKQQSAIEELHQAILKLSQKNQQIINASFWG
ncbi:hypothetical protein [Vibrio splendidus]|nr:hypothetical protein [Vibrio splendidus]